MSTRYRYTPCAPRCAHTQAAYDAYRAAVARHFEEHPGNYHGQPAEPEDGHAGYCGDCRAALLQPGAVWPAEVWAYLNAQAANDCTAHRAPRVFTSARKLPAAPKARAESAEKHRARLLKAYADKLGDVRCSAVVGRVTPDGYRLSATNGYCAFLELSMNRLEEGTPLPYRGWVPGERWIDLPADFHLALSRVALLANEQSHSVTLTVGDGEITVSTNGGEYGTASETVPIVRASEPAPMAGQAVRLNAEYLDPVCGVWPLRWYPATEVEPQVFVSAAGQAEYRAVLMPMRI